ncbi:MAG: phosphonoacetaldehyde hydrolase [Bryobacteraceae bacterium]
MSVRAVIFDISGTTMDWGSRGPVAAFVELFARSGVAITEAEARAPMGLHKRDHVWAILSGPEVSERWRQVHGSIPGSETLDDLYSGFGALQKEVLKRHLDLLPGVAEVAAQLAECGIRIASTTGFETEMMTDLIPAAAEQGYRPEFWVCPDQVGGGRPAPWMIHHAARQLGLYPLRTFVKVGDTPADIAEAHNAGTWAVSVIKTGNEIGLSRTDWEALPESEQAARIGAARQKFLSLGAHYAIDSTADLMPVIESISQRVEKGERP